MKKPAMLLLCDFCLKDERKVKRLIAGPDSVMICNECVRACVEILVEAEHKEKLAHAKDGG